MILCKGTTHAFPLVRGQVQCPTGNYAHTLHQAHERESEKIAAFLREHFKITERSACVITGERIRRGLSAGWIVVFSMVYFSAMAKKCAPLQVKTQDLLISSA